MELHERAARCRRAEPLERRSSEPSGQAAKARADPRLERVVAARRALRPRRASPRRSRPPRAAARAPRASSRTPSSSDERRRPGARLRRGRGARRSLGSAARADDDRRAERRRRRRRARSARTRSARSRERVTAATAARRARSLYFWKVMATYRELLQQVKAEIDEISAREARERLDAERRRSSSTCASRDEWEEGLIPGAVHVPRGYLESRIEGARARPRRASSSSTAPAARAPRSRPRRSSELGYDERASSLAGGFADWKRNGFDVATPRVAHAGAARPLLPPPAHPRGRRGGPAEAARRRACC